MYKKNLSHQKIFSILSKFTAEFTIKYQCGGMYKYSCEKSLYAIKKSHRLRFSTRKSFTENNWAAT